MKAAYEPADVAATWPLAEGRAPFSLLLFTLLGLLGILMAGRRRVGQASAPHRFRFTSRELRGVLRPSSWWRPSVSLTLICALVLAGVPWNVQAAVYTSVFYYYQTDHLGSSTVMTDRAGDKVDYYANTAFGREQFNDPSAAFPMSNRFTGQIFDDGTGLYYYGARYYDPELARFIQPDTIVPGAANRRTSPACRT